MTLRERIKQNYIVADGAMGTYYASIKQDAEAISEMENLNNPALIQEIHRDYIQAGATLLRTNTFAANCYSLHIDALTREEIVRQGCRIAKAAAKEADKDICVAGSVGPIPQHYGIEEESILREYQNILDLLIEEDVDAIVFETFADFYYLESLIPYIRSKSDCFIIADMCVNKNGYTLSGISARRLCRQATEIPELDAFGFNCGIGSGHMLSLLENLEMPEDMYLVAMPNAGYPEQLHSRMVFRDNTQYFADNIEKLSRTGITILGGCCGTTPDHIAAIAPKLKGPRLTVMECNHVSDSHLDSKIKPTRSELKSLLDSGKKVVAVELDPPYDADYEKLIECSRKLQANGCDIITMADSPMGRSRVDAILMSIKIHEETGMKVMPHICCRDKNMIAMRSTLLGAYINNIRNLLVVTGDPVPSESRINTTSVFDYNSIRLMQYMKEMNSEHFGEDPLYYGGALNYARGNLDKVIERMQRKIDAGARFFLSQPAYAKEDVERLYQIKKRVDTKLLCGVMPFVSYRNANFVKNEFFGINVPDAIVNRYHPDMTREEAELVGAGIANELIAELKDFADGYYFMLPFNRVSLMDSIKIQ